MNLFEYLTVRRESKQTEIRKKESAVRKQRIDKLTLEVYELAGEVVGIEYQIRTYQEANRRLVYSNHVETGEMQVDITKKTGRLKALKEQLAALKIEELRHKPSFEWSGYERK